MASIILAEKDLNSVRCGLCKLYLSIGPIYIQSNFEPVCGRCKLPPNNIKSRAVFYEKIAKSMVFPCRNDRYGCDAKLPWKSVQSHEESCQFRTMKCPALHCNYDIRLEVIQEHFRKIHPDLIMNTNEFKILSNINVSETNRLYIWKNKEYLVQISYYDEACFFNISSFSETSDNLFYDIVINDETNSGEIHIRKEEIRKYEKRNHDYSKMKKVDHNALSKLLGKNIFCKFTITGKETCSVDPLNTRLLSNLECTVCFEYMKPPIYMCDKGHCLCGTCNSKLSQCPSCRDQLNNCRNFALEKISEDVLYPCKHLIDGCNFLGKNEELAGHENSCYIPTMSLKKYSCFLKFPKPCSWTGEVKQYSEHIRTQHENHFMRLGIPLTLMWGRANHIVYFTSYNTDVFRVTFEYGHSVGFRIKIVNISDNNKCIYKFVVNFVGNDDESLILTRKCGENSVDFNKHLVKPFIKNNKISIKVNILEIN